MEKFSYTFIPSPMVCPTLIEVKITGDTVESVVFTRGCNGNAKAINALASGMNVRDVINRLSGIQCKDRGTSCADQLARCLQKAVESRKKWNGVEK